MNVSTRVACALQPIQSYLFALSDSIDCHLIYAIYSENNYVTNRVMPMMCTSYRYTSITSYRHTSITSYRYTSITSYRYTSITSYRYTSIAVCYGCRKFSLATLIENKCAMKLIIGRYTPISMMISTVSSRFEERKTSEPGQDVLNIRLRFYRACSCQIKLLTYFQLGLFF